MSTTSLLGASARGEGGDAPFSAIGRPTQKLRLAQKQAGWARLQSAYLTLGDDEAGELMRRVED